MIAKKRRLRKKWQQRRTLENKNKLNNITQRLKREIMVIKNESINKYLRELSGAKEADYSLWRATKKLKRMCVQSPPIRNPDRQRMGTG